MERPLIAILDNKDQLLCVTDDYFDGNLHRFLQGTAAFFRCSILQNSELSQYFVVGNKISFFYNATAFHFDITDMVKDEEIVTIQADSLTLELRNEQIPAYKATKAMSFEEYLKVFLFTGDNPLVMGINEVSNKKLQLEWEAENSNIMSRLFSLATKFDAEIEFVTRLNQHWGLLDIVLNVFVANSDKYQGIGNNRQDIILELGNNVETIEIHENIDDLKTAIKPIGKDGLLITNVVIDEKDADGNRLFYSPKGDAHIRAVQAKNQFISKVNGEGYISYPWEYDTENENVLAGQGLAELKKRAKVTLTVTVKGFDKTLQIGDTVRVLNEAYNPSLNMTMRVSELDIYFDKPSNDSGVFTNAQILQSEVDTTLLARVQALIEANKVFTYDIITSDGVTFKNGFGSTTLTARVRDGIKDITDTFSLKWYKDGTLFSNTKTVTINAADIEEKAVFRFEVADDSGNVRGGAEVTITNIDDGKKGEPGETYYPHRGYLMADGTLVNQVPNENLLNARLVYPSSNNATAYPISNTTMVEDGKQFNRTMRANPTSQPGIFSIFTAIDITAFAAKLAGKRVGLSVMVRGSSPVNMMLMARYRIAGGESSIFPGEANERVDVRTYWTQVKFVVESFPANIDLLRFNPLSIINPVPDLSKFYLDMRDWKVEILEPGQEPSYYTTPPNVDYENAYPKYEGFYSDTNVEGSDNADDYKPWKPFMGPQGKDGYTPVKNVDYFDGQPGQNGKSAYLWIR
ncbi:phage tail protein, partial [Enterococcus casseliflavus]|uniref:phage tail spike protein n=1 Tax=Enterococcus casseliflavus TaxID=37734 RepID=UPI001E622A9D